MAGDTYCSDPAKPVPYLPRPVIDPLAELGTGTVGASYDAWSTRAGAGPAIRGRPAGRT